MNFAVLGTDSDILALVDAAIAAGHSLVWLTEVRPEDAAEIARLSPGRTVSSEWESLLDHNLADAVLVGRGMASEEVRADQLKRLTADAVPLLVVYPATESVLTYYELDMARHESRCVLRHYSPLVACPANAELAEWVRSGASELGAVHQVVLERRAVDCRRGPILWHLARDMELLRIVGGDVRTVNAVGPRVTDESFASLQVQMTGRGTATFRWAVTPAAGSSEQATLNLIGERGSARLRLPDEAANEWRLDVSIGDRSEVSTYSATDGARAAIDALVAALPANGSDRSDAASTWSQATATMEIVDAIELSLQKGRTIEVLPQKLTRDLAFRGTMAAFGCGLLLLMLFLMVAAGLAGDVLGVPLRSIWPVALLVVLGMFLMLQVVPWLSTNRPPDAGSNDNEPS